MKFKFGDLVYYKPTSGPKYHGISVMQVISYDKKRRKYKCIDIDEADCVPYKISYTSTKDMDFLRKVENEEDYQKNGKAPFSLDDIQKMDPFLNIYDCEGRKSTLIRKAVRHTLS